MRSGVPSALEDLRRLARALGRVRRDARVERLPLAHGAVERAHRLLERRVRVEPMRVEDVDVVEAQPAQALVEAREEVLPRAPLAVRAGPHVVAGLRRDHELVAVRREVGGEQPPERLLRRAVRRAVVVREVEVGDRRDRTRAGRSRGSSRAADRRRSCVQSPSEIAGQLQSASPAAAVGHAVVAIVGGDVRHPVLQSVVAASSSKGRSASGSASESRLSARSAGSPERIRLTGTSSTLPESVRGTAGTARTSSGT